MQAQKYVEATTQPGDLMQLEGRTAMMALIGWDRSGSLPWNDPADHEAKLSLRGQGHSSGHIKLPVHIACKKALASRMCVDCSTSFFIVVQIVRHRAYF